MLPFALAIGLGSFLSFVVQPLVARQLLPAFGGTPAVWTTSLVFFQLALVVGYGYAHVLTRLPGRRQAIVHVVAAGIAILFLPVLVADTNILTGAHPTIRALALLALTVGVPYVVLAASAPLLQHWAHVRSGAEPIRLYAISNAASLTALLVYPTLLEPFLSVRAQGWIWSALFVGYVAAAFVCARVVMRLAATTTSLATEAATSAPAPLIDRAIWLAASASGSALLMASTNQLCQDIASVPFLWIAPLTVYLASFILAFAGWYRRSVWAPLFLGAMVCTAYVLENSTSLSPLIQGASLLLLLGAGCMVCHGELVLLRPAPDRLSGFYLMISIGGALGGLAIAVAAPRLFTTYVEFPLLVLAVIAVLGAAAGRSLERRAKAPMPRWLWLGPLVLFLGIGGTSVIQATSKTPGITARRNFFGVLRVSDNAAKTIRTLYHGRVVHGQQFLDAARRRQATSYFGPASGVGRAFTMHPLRVANRPMRIGVIGLGIGTIAAWGRPGDSMRFFEINPDVVDLARSHFTYVTDSAANVDIVVADGRLGLEEERARLGGGIYDLLILDAFAGDAIPTHLLTTEAMRTYRALLAPHGVLALHVSNHFLDLRQVVAGLAQQATLQAAEIEADMDTANGLWASVWMLLADDLTPWTAPVAGARVITTLPPAVLWTDDYSSLWKVLKK